MDFLSHLEYRINLGVANLLLADELAADGEVAFNSSGTWHDGYRNEPLSPEQLQAVLAKRVAALSREELRLAAWRAAGWRVKHGPAAGWRPKASPVNK